MTDFERAVDIVLRREGVLSDDRRDPGGLTKYGISQAAYPNLNIPALTVSDAVEIYRRDYWTKAGCDGLPWPISLLVFDGAVNQGVSPAARLVQESAGVAVDGAIGPATRAAVARKMAADPVDFAADYLSRRALRYAGTTNFNVYGRGWLKRLFLVLQEGGR